MNTYIEDMDRQEAAAQREGPVARSIEKRTAKIPSDVYLWAAGASMVASLALEVFGLGGLGKKRSLKRFVRAREARASMPFAGFVGLWAPSLLLLGVYNKIVKVAGSDRTDAMSSI